MAAPLSLSTDFSRGRPKETATVIKYAQCRATLKGKIDQSDGAVLKDTVLVYTNSGRTLGGQGLGQDTVGTHLSDREYQRLTDGDFLIQSHTPSKLIQ